MPAPIVVAKVGLKVAKRLAPQTTEKVTHHLRRCCLLLLLVLPVASMAAFAGGVVAPMRAAAGSCPPGAPVPSSTELDQPTIDGINNLKPLYEQVGAAKDVSWALLAGIDYRESNNGPNQSSAAGEPLGTPNPDHDGLVFTTKREALEWTADTLRAGASQVYGVTLTTATGGPDLQATIVAYGRWAAYKQAGADPASSPYVMNQYDDAHRNMVFPAVPGETLAGDTDTRFGAYTIFTRLGGSTAGGCGASSFTIVRIAQEQIGLREDPDGCNCGPSIQKFLGSSTGEFWCADFVSWVYMTAGVPFTGGADGGWRLAGVPGLHSWFQAHGQWHVPGDGDLPRPGDVILFGDEDHVGIVERAEGASVHTVEGNAGNQVSRRDYPTTADGGYAPIILGWGRMNMSAGTTPTTLPTGTATTVAPGQPAPGQPAPGVVVDEGGLPSNWTESNDCTYWNWGVGDPSTKVIHYCVDKINQSGGSASLWDYVIKHERCHARAFEGFESFPPNDEHEADMCAAADGADTSWSPYHSDGGGSSTW